MALAVDGGLAHGELGADFKNTSEHSGRHSLHQRAAWVDERVVARSEPFPHRGRVV